MAADPYKSSGNFIRRSDLINGPIAGTFGNAIIFDRLIVLSQDDLALGLYCLYSRRAIGSSPETDDADSIQRLVLGKKLVSASNAGAAISLATGC